MDLLKSVKSKRPKTVIEHILKHGHVTSEELKEVYGYHHPPRAARDVRELGIPLETFHLPDAQGRSIAAYKFGDPQEIRSGILAGRKVFSKEFKQSLVENKGCKCGICDAKYESRYLQIDHCVPYEVGGETSDRDKLDDFQLLCGSCNRAKSWSCEHCLNGNTEKKVNICRSCYWASPNHYKHVALKPIRRLDISWVDEETAEYDQLLRKAAKDETTITGFC